jgi:hypothetical protein
MIPGLLLASTMQLAVADACTRASAGLFEKPAVKVYAEGTPVYGIALVSRFGRAAVCVYDKKTKRAQLSGVMNVPPAARQVHRAPARIIDCTGKPVTEPNEVVFACADANLLARKLQWVGWSEPLATGVGELSVNTCTPYCAAGTFVSYKVALIARGSQRCGNALAYDTVTFAVIGKPPANLGPETYTYPCRPR